MSSEIATPLSITMNAQYPEDDCFAHSFLPKASFSPLYQTTIEVLVGEKVRVYTFESPQGNFVEREATLAEYKTGLAFKEAQDEQRTTYIG